MTEIAAVRRRCRRRLGNGAVMYVCSGQQKPLDPLLTLILPIELPRKVYSHARVT